MRQGWKHHLIQAPHCAEEKGGTCPSSYAKVTCQTGYKLRTGPGTQNSRGVTGSHGL